MSCFCQQNFLRAMRVYAMHAHGAFRLTSYNSSGP
jgi:hypothetical protein